MPDRDTNPRALEATRLENVGRPRDRADTIRWRVRIAETIARQRDRDLDRRRRKADR